jgi:hypothetical protein
VKSGKQRRQEIKARRARRPPPLHKDRPQPDLTGTAPCNTELLAPYNSYGVPQFVSRGYYVDISFRCQGCGSEEIWRATQQKWWYEVAKGYVYSTAKLCRPCRRAEQARRAAAQKTAVEGLARKSTKAKPA